MALAPPMNSVWPTWGLWIFSLGLSLFICKRSFWSNGHEVPLGVRLRAYPRAHRWYVETQQQADTRPEFKPGFHSAFLPGTGLWAPLSPQLLTAQWGPAPCPACLMGMLSGQRRQRFESTLSPRRVCSGCDRGRMCVNRPGWLRVRCVDVSVQRTLSRQVTVFPCT